MAIAKSGDTVRVDYRGRLDDGSVFDTTDNREPLEFVLGQEGLIPAFQAGVVGMTPGDKKTIKVAPEEAYGVRREEMVVKVDRAQFGEGVAPQVGQHFQVPQESGSPVQVTVIGVADNEVTLDANHPLAGQTLTFELSLVEVVQ